MSDIRFKCPACNQPLKAPPKLAGKMLDCPKCKKQIKIPIPPPDASSAFTRQETQGPTNDRPHHRMGGPKQTTPSPGSSSAQASKKRPTGRRIRAIILTVFCLGSTGWIIYLVNTDSATRERADLGLNVLILLFFGVLFYVIYRGFRRKKDHRQWVGEDAVPKNPGLAAVLSLFIWGGGQIYNGQFGKGLVFILLEAVFWVSCFLLVPGMMLLVGAWGLYNVFDAYKSAVKFNSHLKLVIASTMKKCPYCAEMIKDEAIVCRYCGRAFK